MFVLNTCLPSWSQRKALVWILTVLFACSLFAQGPSKPQISAFYDRIDDGPAFFVECRNTSGKALSSGDKRWTNALRIDGAIVPEPELYMPPGLTTKVAPGGTWRGILALWQSYRSFFPAVKFGSLVRSAPVLTVNEGKHTLAVHCGELWSDDFTFYWDGETHL
jgi:hypothetical protein